jgi:hypothetical protein
MPAIIFTKPGTAGIRSLITGLAHLASHSY